MKKIHKELDKILQIDDKEEKHIALDALMIYVLKTVGFDEFANKCQETLKNCWYA